MADAPNTVGTSSLNALIQDRLHDTIIKTVPEELKVQRMVPFEVKNGRKILAPVFLTSEHGVTYSKPDNGAFALEESVAAVAQEAQIEPYQIVTKSTMSYEAAFRMDGGPPKARQDAVKAVMENMNETNKKRTEIDLFYGQTSLGAVNAATSSSTSFVISEATWAAGIWAGMKNAKITIQDSGLATAEDTDESISSVTIGTRTIVVGNAQTLDAGDLVYFKGAVAAGSPAVHHSMPGIDAIVTNSGTLFNIAANTYELWAGTTVSSVGQPTMAKLLNGVSYAVNLGCMEDLVYFCSPKQFEVLNTDIAALRRQDASYRSSKAESGSESITFYSQNGKLEIVPHIFVKDGDGFIVPIKRMKRQGSTDTTFKRPGVNGGDNFALDIAGYAGFELRCYTAQAVWCERPAWMVKLTGITYA